MSRKVVWKINDQEQLSLLPPSYDDLVPKNHPVRIVNAILDQIDLSALEKTYKGGGTSSYHPKLLLKILIYAYLRNLYSLSKIEEALGENLQKKKNWPKNLDKYNRQEKQMGTRNSMGKTNHDATFMRMKDDHMQNGQLKRGITFRQAPTISS